MIIRIQTLFRITLIALIALGCNQNKTQTSEEKSAVAKPIRTDSIFEEVFDYPTIKDSTKFMSDLRRIYKIEIDESATQKEEEEITTYKKVKIYGSNKEYFFIEYDYKTGCGAYYPYKLQLVISPEGKLVKRFGGEKFEFAEIFEGKNPFLMIIIEGSHGTGWHEFYKITADTLENVYDGYTINDLYTVEGHEDIKIFEPNELNLTYKDYNQDGFNDIFFTGNIVYLGRTKRIKPIEFIFLYNQKTGHFVAKENYNRKYHLND